MACRRTYRNTNINDPLEKAEATRLVFGVDSKVPANNLLQNNLDLFEWVTRNKVYPAYWGRNIIGENSLTKDEIKFLHDKTCRIAAICYDSTDKETEEQGRMYAQKVADIALKLGIPLGTAIFLEIGEAESNIMYYLRGFADALINEGYTPGFKANTDAKYSFDHAFSRMMRTNKDIFEKCLVWATAPFLRNMTA